MAERERGNNNNRERNGGNKAQPKGGSGNDGQRGEPRQIIKKNDSRATSSSTQAATSTSASSSGAAPAPTSGRRVLLDMLKGPATAAAGASSGLLSETGVKVHSRELEIYGVILSIKNTFGFIQAIYEDEQYYFSDREFYDNMKVADKVAFIPRSSQKGPSAHNVRFLIPTFTKLQPSVQGSITRCPERHRSGCGLIEVDLSTVSNPEVKTLLEGKLKKQIVYRPTNILPGPKNHFMDRGDLVEFTLTKMHDSNMIVANEIKLKQLKRDRAVALQIQRMLDAGAIREVGVVSAVKNKEYGFIRAQDRKEELYFKLDDFAEENVKIEEGMEVDFFVIAEIIKGKLSDRAIHLKVIPKGTVQFEVVVASDIAVRVAVEPVGEVPGTAVLSKPIDVSDLTNTPNHSISCVDLWQRCMPDDLLVKKGDSLLINIHFYRPEKLFFARAVRVDKFFPMGRDTGSIIALKEQAFGFILSETRKVDLYFKTNHVVNADGEMMSASDLTTGMKVNFDITVEESKLRASRVQVVKSSSGSSTDVSEDNANSYLLKKDVLGTVIRSVVKKDAVGLIMLTESVWRDIQALEFIDPHIDNEIKQFRNSSELTSFELSCLPSFLVRAYTGVIDKLHSRHVKYETSAIPGVDNNLRNLKIWKEESNPQPTAAAATAALTSLLNPSLPPAFPIPILTSTGIVMPPTPTTPVADPVTPVTPAGLKPPKDGFTIQYIRDDVKLEDVSSLGNDMEVYFDVYWDRLKGKKVARNVRITEEIIPGETTRVSGVIEVVFEKGDRFGFIRTIPNDEKLFWHSAGISKDALSNLSVGRFVTFEIRRRGGMRWATNVQVADPPSDLRQTLPDVCLALCVDANTAVIIDIPDTCVLKDRFVPLPWFDEAMATSQTGKQWEKVQEKSQAPPGINGSESSAGGNGLQSSTAQDSINAQGSIITPLGRVEYKPKFFGAIPRLPLPIMQHPSEDALTLVPGDMFKCQCMMSWTEKRSPIVVVPLELVEMKATKRKARVSKMKFKLRNNPSLLSPLRFTPQSVEFIEMLDVQDKSKGEVVVTGNVCYSYCEFNDIQPASADFTKEGLQVNDDIEYWVTPNNTNAAFGVRILPKMQFSELKFNHGPGINDQLKEQKSKSIGVATNVVMAKGPPNDTTQGFEAGWRPIDLDAIAKLPWATMLSHLSAGK